MSGMTTVWFLGMVMGSALALGANCAIAQQSNIVPDNTLGADRSVVVPLDPDFPIDAIFGGKIQGPNLFHSFREFNVSENRGAYFFSPTAAIQNILARVTGGNRSEILGVIGTLGGFQPNLFLINPNGIIFGSNAILDVRGSFVATTANAIQFGNQGFFSASAPEAASLLTINPSAFLFNQITAQPINSIENRGFLAVPEGRSLLLLGGNVSLNPASTGKILIDGGNLQAPGGRIEIGGVAEAGTVGLNIDNNNLRLSFPDNVALTDISLTNRAVVNASGESGGNIQIQGRRVALTDNSSILMNTLGAKPGGTLAINGSESVEVSGRSNLSLGSSGTGSAGELTISTERLIVKSNAFIGSGTIGLGRGGNLIVNASDSVEVAEGGILTTSTLGDGDQAAGDLKINTGRLIVRDTGFLETGTRGEGQGGNLSVTASDSVDVAGGFLSTGTDGAGTAGDLTVFASNAVQVSDGGVLSTSTDGTGSAGDLIISTERFVVQNGALLSSDTAGQGQGGNLSVTASDSVDVVGGFLSTATEGNQAAGDLAISTRRLIVRDDALINTSTVGQGKGGDLTVIAPEFVEVSSAILSTLAEGAGAAGDLRIATGRLSIRDGALLANTDGQGRGGNLSVTASNSVEVGNGGILSTGTDGAGNGGDLAITTGRLFVRDGSIDASTGTESQGRGGNLTVTTSEFVEAGNDANISTGTRGSGTAGDLTIGTKRLIVRDGAFIDAATSSTGQGGNLTVTASESVEVVGNSIGLFAGAFDAGNGGNLRIDTGRLIIRDGAQVAVSSRRSGEAGNLIVTANSIFLDRGAIAAETLASISNEGGANITLQVSDLLLLRNQSQISAQAFGQANGGNVRIDADFIVAVPSENSDIIANAVEGNGGRVNITASGIFGIQFREDITPLSDITASSIFGASGVVEINTPDIDPNSGLVNLPLVPIDTEVAQGCYSGGAQAQSEFIITGRGGLPPNPGEPLTTDAVQVDLITLNPSSDNRRSPTVTKKPSKPIRETIVEATGWVINSFGEVELIANAPTATPGGSWQTPINCSASKTPS